MVSDGQKGVVDKRKSSGDNYCNRLKITCEEIMLLVNLKFTILM